LHKSCDDPYDTERELFIATLVGLLKRARDSTDDHALFSDIGEALPYLSKPRSTADIDTISG